MEPNKGGCCRCCFSFIFTLGLTALFLWLSLRASKPSCTVKSLYIPTLNETLKTPDNTTVFFTLNLANGNKDKGINYDDVNLTLSYLPNASDPKSAVKIGDTKVPAFYQGHKKKANKKVNFSGSGFNWTGVREGAFGNHSYTAAFRVDLATAVRFKIMAWRTKRQRLQVGGNVVVGYLGEELNKKGQVNKKGTKLSGGDRNRGLGFGFGALISFGVWLFI